MSADDEGFKIALEEAKKGASEGGIPIGACLVSKDGKNPELLLLMPSIEPDFECLYDVPLPFAEDVRPYQFPPLDRLKTITGKTLTG